MTRDRRKQLMTTGPALRVLKCVPHILFICTTSNRSSLQCLIMSRQTGLRKQVTSSRDHVCLGYSVRSAGQCEVRMARRLRHDSEELHDSLSYTREVDNPRRTFHPWSFQMSGASRRQCSRTAQDHFLSGLGIGSLRKISGGNLHQTCSSTILSRFSSLGPCFLHCRDPRVVKA